MNLKDAVGVDESDVGVEMIAVVDAVMQPLQQLRVRQVAVVNGRYTHRQTVGVIIQSYASGGANVHFHLKHGSYGPHESTPQTTF